MRRSSIRISRSMLIVILIIVGALFLVLPDAMTGKFHDVFIYVLGPVLKVGPDSNITDLPGLVVSERKVSLSKYKELEGERDKLVSRLKTLQRKYLYLHEEYELATGTRQRLPDVGPGHIWAEVIRADVINSEIDINRGMNDGLKKGQYVISQDVLIGTVDFVGDYYAKVKLLTAKDHELIVEIEAIDSKKADIYRRAIMKGDGKGGCLIDGIQTNYQITDKNFVYAYARPGYLNSPLIIGKVSHIKYDDSDPLFWKINVQPSFDITKLEKVFAVTMEPGDITGVNN